MTEVTSAGDVLISADGKAGDDAVDGLIPSRILLGMKGKFAAIIETAPEGGYWAICPEVPGANGEGETVAAAKRSLRDAIRLIFAHRVADARRGLPDEAIPRHAEVKSRSPGRF